MKRAQKKFERDPRKKFFCERNPTLWAKAKIHEQSSWINKAQIINSLEWCKTQFQIC